MTDTAHAQISLCYDSNFQGDLSPLSTRSIIESCVMSVLLYGCENGIVSESCLKQLESFLGELAKRALKWPKHFPNTAAVTGLEIGTIRSRLVVRELGFLTKQLLDNITGIGSISMRSLVDDPDSLCLVKECQDLEDFNGPHYTKDILADAGGCCM